MVSIAKKSNFLVKKGEYQLYERKENKKKIRGGKRRIREAIKETS